MPETNLQNQREIPVRMLRVGHLVSLPGLIRAHGVDPLPILAQAGFTPEQFQDPDNRIPFLPGSRLLEAAAQACGNEYFGLALGETFQAAHLGLAGFTAQSAATLGEALQQLAQNLVLHDEGGSVTFEQSGEFVFLGYAVHQRPVHALDIICQMSLVVSCRILRTFLGDDWKPSEVWFARREPLDDRPVQRFFRAPLRFDSAHNCLVFKASFLRQPILGADGELNTFLSEQANVEHKRNRTDFLHLLQKVVHEALLAGDDSLQAVAARLGLHSRSLNRRLQQRGTTFRDQRDRQRRERAAYLVEHTDLPVGEIAEAVGYSDTSAFDHAFRRWFGVNPERWRRQQRGRRDD